MQLDDPFLSLHFPSSPTSYSPKYPKRIPPLPCPSIFTYFQALCPQHTHKQVPPCFNTPLPYRSMSALLLSSSTKGKGSPSKPPKPVNSLIFVNTYFTFITQKYIKKEKPSTQLPHTPSHPISPYPAASYPLTLSPPGTLFAKCISRPFYMLTQT